MLKKMNNFISIFMWCSIGVFIGTSVFKYWDYKKYPDLYAVQSAPWYLGIQIHGIALFCILIICLVIKTMIKKKQGLCHWGKMAKKAPDLCVGGQESVCDYCDLEGICFTRTETLETGGNIMSIRKLETERLILRAWKESDDKSLFLYASDPDVGPIAGWPPHKSMEESREVIKNVLCGAECYAICEKANNIAIGTIELKLNGHTDMTERDDECELGYWLGKPFWGRGYMPEAGKELIRHAFEDLGMTKIWCGYYDGNGKSKRVQEKLGFRFHHTCENVAVPLMNEIRTGHTNYMTREQWKNR